MCLEDRLCVSLCAELMLEHPVLSGLALTDCGSASAVLDRHSRCVCTALLSISPSSGVIYVVTTMSEKGSGAPPGSSDGAPTAELPPPLCPAYEDSASLISLWSLSWVWRLSALGRKRRLLESDMADVGFGNGCEVLADQLERLLARYQIEDAASNATFQAASASIWQRFVSHVGYRFGLRERDGRRKRGITRAAIRVFAPKLALSAVPFVLSKAPNLAIAVLVRVRQHNRNDTS